METKDQQNPFATAKPAGADQNKTENSLRHAFPAWDLVPPHAPVRKGADA